ncbi:MAG: tail fiber domain-containing protein [Flavobacteriales bacterium]|nr:tail fiber domain-containing protein [Flavobacteriales bacterium]
MKTHTFLLFAAVSAIAMPSAAQSWKLVGNAGTNTGTNFVGTTDNVPLVFKVNGTQAGMLDHLLSNTSYGFKAGLNITSGELNSAFGAKALENLTTGGNNAAMGSTALFNTTTGWNNIAIGNRALYRNTVGNANVAIGRRALHENVAGSQSVAIGTEAMYNANPAVVPSPTYNVAVGYQALYGSATPPINQGVRNTAVGHQALWSNSSGGQIVAIGNEALFSNTTGNYLNAVGTSALYHNTTGTENTAMGQGTLFGNSVGNYNVAVGNGALYFNEAGSGSVALGYHAMFYANSSSTPHSPENTAVGYEALRGEFVSSAGNTGIRNTAVGDQAMLTTSNGSYNVAVGTEALYNNTTGSYLCGLGRSALNVNTTGWDNTAIGYSANVSFGDLHNATALGAFTTATASNKVRLGNTGVTTVEGQVAYSWPSDARFKRNVEEDVPGLDLITRLRPVSYTFDRAAFAKHIGEGNGMPEDERPEPVAAPETRTVGFLAQEVEATVKELGYAAFDAVRAPSNPKDNYSLAYAEFVVPLVKAVQELAAENKLMKEELASTNAKLDALIAAQQERDGASTKEGELKVFPVPASDLVRVEIPPQFNGKSGNLEMLDAQGRSAHVQAISSLGTSFDLPLPARLAEGTYMVVLKVAGEQPATARVVIHR